MINILFTSQKEPGVLEEFFFDYETKNWEKNFKFVRELGMCFIDIQRVL